MIGEHLMKIRCRVCGEPFAQWTLALRHAKTHRPEGGLLLDLLQTEPLYRSNFEPQPNRRSEEAGFAAPEGGKREQEKDPGEGRKE